MDEDEEAYYARLAAVERPTDLKISERSGTEGDRHDPYGWSEWTVTMPDGRKAMWRQGILSERLELTSEIGTVTFFSPNYDESLGSYKDLFEGFVGYDFEQIHFWYNVQYEQYADVWAAEMAAGWDPNP